MSRFLYCFFVFFSFIFSSENFAFPSENFAFPLENIDKPSDDISKSSKKNLDKYKNIEKKEFLNDKKAAIVIDYTNKKKILFQESAYRKRYPASLTKIMTIYLLFESLKNKKIDFNTKFKVSKLASIQIPSKLSLKIGDEISVLNIIKALVVKSANDAAIVAAEGLCGNVSKFCDLMNKKAKSLGMKSTNFVNPSGVPNKLQISTARDIAILTMALYKNFPQYWDLLSLKSFRYNNITYSTHCKILHWYKGADGAKTGYINASGFNLSVTSQKYNKSSKKAKRLFVVVMGWDSSKSRDFYAAKLMDKYLDGYDISDNKQYNTKKAREKLLEQVSKSEMLEPIIQEDEVISVNDIIKNRKALDKYFDDLYKIDEDVIQIEEVAYINPEKTIDKTDIKKVKASNSNNTKKKLKKKRNKYKIKKSKV